MTHDSNNPNPGLVSFESNPDANVAYRVDEVRKGHARGWDFIPLKGKVPKQTAWSKRPRADLATSETWARGGNIGLRTGQVSGVVVVDDDTIDGTGAASLKLPKTVTVITGSGRRQYYFKAPAEPIKNSVSKIADHVDIRGDGGQAVFPGSIHPVTGKPYVWAPGLSPDEVELADLPAHVLAMLSTKDAKSSETPPKDAPPTKLTEKELERLRVYCAAALRNAAARVAGTQEGARNDILNKEAFKVGTFVGANLVDRNEAMAALAAAAEHAGLSSEEARTTIESGLAAGEAAPRDAREMFERLQQKSAKSRSAVGRPTILVVGGELPQIVDDTENALLGDHSKELFEYSNLIIRLVRTFDPIIADGVMRPIGSIAIRVVDATYMIERFTLAASFEKPGRKENVPIDCPAKVAKTYLSREGRRKLRNLAGVIEAPTLRPDGSILDTPGYDEATGLYLYLDATTFPPIPASPTKEDAASALAKLKNVIREFPFVGDSDRSAALSAVLTATIRRSLRTAPMFAFSAPKPGSGKSLLTDVASMIATGHPCAVMSQGKDEDEDRKRMLALLLDGESVACIDNIDRPLGGAALCSVLTQVTFKDRVLGFSKTAKVSTNLTWFANGNNLTIAGDLTSRVVFSELDPGVENPEERKFAVNLYQYIPEHRGELVVAALTILRAYHVAGRPAQKLSVFGRFEAWSDWVRSALVWLGEADPCIGRARIQQADPVREMLRNVVVRWHDLLGDACFTVAEVVARAVATKVQTADGTSLFDALYAVAPTRDPNEIEKKRLGHWLRNFTNRIEGGLRIERAGDRKGTAVWRVCVAPLKGPATEPDPRDATLGGDPTRPPSDTDDTDSESSSGSTAEIPPNPQNPPVAAAAAASDDQDDL